MAFKKRKRAHSVADNPESLFADIKTKKVPGLLAHQADILRDYHQNHLETSDLAIQLPTGSGKTLVALLMGEWRRVSERERVVFLCPTRQLVNQVKTQACDKYGLNVVGFTGKIKSYSSSDKASYLSGDAMAITTYSSLFNSNPFFEDPHTIIIDDAHAAEQYVASNWTLDIRKYQAEDIILFNAISAVIKHIVDEITFRRFTAEAESSGDLSWFDMVPQERLFEVSDELNGVISSHIGNSKHSYAWSALTGNLRACNIFLGSQTIYIRPYLSPTFSHKPFSGAKQRIYLSATPGEGGELERIFCRRKITRLTPPQGWDKHTIGRRFFIFPELSLEEEEQFTLLLHLANQHRVLLLAGDNNTAEKFQTYLSQNSHTKIFNASDIEDSKSAFIQSPSAVAILANRYDGIDFPEEECRFTILCDIPTASNPQEKFLISRLSASRVHDVRILTRIIQAFGRCTRGSTDYSAVLIFGEQLLAYLSKSDRQKFFHPELQGEIIFGFDQGKECKFNDIIENIQHYLLQDNDWIEAQEEIYEIRDQSTKHALPGSDCLETSAEFEVRYVESIWNGDFEAALEHCRTVIGKLTDPELKGERALWHYLAGSIASLISPSSDLKKTLYRSAANAAPGLSWLHSLNRLVGVQQTDEDLSKATIDQLDRIEAKFEKLGLLSSRKYDNLEADIRGMIANSEQFEQGHVKLGELLGFSAGKIESDGSPDPWWEIAENIFIVFEDHAGGNPDSKLSVDKSRQAATHKNWILSNIAKTNSPTIHSILITPVAIAGETAISNLREVVVLDLANFQRWVNDALQHIRTLRRGFTGAGDLKWRTNASQELKRSGLAAESILETLKRNCGKSLQKN
jgi:hypothetical protein